MRVQSCAWQDRQSKIRIECDAAAIAPAKARDRRKSDARAQAADTVTEKLKAGFEVDESDQAGRQEGVPRIPSGVE